MIFIWSASVIVLIAMKIVGPAETLDVHLYYNQMDTWSFFQTLGAEDAIRYFRNELLDLVFIGLYSSLLYISFERLTRLKKTFRKIAYLPGCFDLIETFWILAVLKTGDISGPVLWLGVMTFLKWTTGFIVLLSLGFLSIRSRRSLGAPLINKA